MRLTIIINNLRHDIDSADPEMLGKWVIEIIARNRHNWTPATDCRVQAQPSFMYNPATNRWMPDWVTDNRIIGDERPFRTPADLLKALGEQIERAEQLETREKQ